MFFEVLRLFKGEIKDFIYFLNIFLENPRRDFKLLKIQNLLNSKRKNYQKFWYVYGILQYSSKKIGEKLNHIELSTIVHHILNKE